MFATSRSHLCIENTIIWFITLNVWNYPSIIFRSWCWSCRHSLRSSSSRFKFLKNIYSIKLQLSILNSTRQMIRSYLIRTTLVSIIAKRSTFFLIRQGTIPGRWSAKLDKAISFQVISSMKADLVLFIERTNCPDDSLGSISFYLTVQFIAGLQGSLISYDAITIHHCCV